MQPGFRFVCVTEALLGAPSAWAREMLRDGDVALLAGTGGLREIEQIARALDLVSIALVLGDPASGSGEDAVLAHAGSLPLVWVAPAFSDRARAWARDRGPMTLLLPAAGPLSAQERGIIDRFVATLGRQSE